jgi:hypothetical protein
MRAIGLQYADSYFHYVVLGDCGEVMSRGTVRANQEDLKREFRAFEPTCVALDGSYVAARWAVDVLTRLDHAVHIDSRLVLHSEAIELLPVAEGYAAMSAELAASKAEQHARQVRNQWTRGVAAMRAAAMETAIHI